MKRRHRQAPRLPDGPVATDYCIAEVRADRSNPSLVTLYLDGAESSCLDLDDPFFLEFEYMQHMALVLEAVHGSAALRLLHLGAAGCALPRALDATHPGSRQLAVDIDAKLAEYVRRWFALPPSPRLRIRAGDGRATLDTTKAKWDAIIRDAFANRTVPESLLTLEAAARARDVLGPNGLYLANAVLSPTSDTLGPDLAAICAAFEHVLTIADPAVLARKRIGNVVIAASGRELPVAEIDRLVRRLPLRATVSPDGEVRSRARAAKPARDLPAPAGLEGAQSSRR